MAHLAHGFDGLRKTSFRRQDYPYSVAPESLCNTQLKPA